MITRPLFPPPWSGLARVLAVALIALALAAVGWTRGATHVQGLWDTE